MEDEGAGIGAELNFVDGRCDLHRHNFPRRTKCHKAERLLELWLATKPGKVCKECQHPAYGSPLRKLMRT